MRILITGGSGFIASHLVTHMVKKYLSYYIVNLDKLDTCSSIHNNDSVTNQPHHVHKGRHHICRSHELCFGLEKIDTIIHAAAQSHVDASFGNSFSFTHTMCMGRMCYSKLLKMQILPDSSTYRRRGVRIVQ